MISIFNNDFDILKYIGNSYDKCLYLYIDYLKYNHCNDTIKIYFQKKDNRVLAILLNYSTSLHIYSKHLDCDYYELSKFIKNNNFKAIFGQKQIVEELSKYLTNYNTEYGYVRKYNCNQISNIENVEIAKENDLEEISQLIMMDKDLASSYEKNDLYHQLLERYNQKFGRNYIIRMDDKIVAHVATNGQTEKVAIISLVMVHPDYRRNGLASKLLKKITSDLKKEGKEAYLINYTNESSFLYEKLGFNVINDWGKLFK